MGSSIWLLLFSIVHITLHHRVAPTITQTDVLCTSEAEYCWRCADFGNYTNGSIFQQNLISLLSSFSNTSQNQANYGFHNSSLGQGSNKVNAIALCRGDLGLEGCRSCFSDSTQSLMRNCSYKMEAILWAEPCMVRYSQDLIFGIKEEDPVRYLPSPNYASNEQAFRLVLNPLLEILSDKAASGDSRQKYAAGHATVPGYETIYAHAQCTPDIDKVNCSNCLKNCISALPACCSGKSGARVLKPSCNIRFENNLFYMSTADSQVNIPAPAPATPTTPETPSPHIRSWCSIIYLRIIRRNRFRCLKLLFAHVFCALLGSPLVFYYYILENNPKKQVSLLEATLCPCFLCLTCSCYPLLDHIRCQCRIISQAFHRYRVKALKLGL